MLPRRLAPIRFLQLMQWPLSAPAARNDAQHPSVAPWRGPIETAPSTPVVSGAANLGGCLPGGFGAQSRECSDVSAVLSSVQSPNVAPPTSFERPLPTFLGDHRSRPDSFFAVVRGLSGFGAFFSLGMFFMSLSVEAIARHATLVANLAQQMMELEELRRALCLQMARRARPKGARQPVRRATRPLVHCRFH